MNRILATLFAAGVVLSVSATPAIAQDEGRQPFQPRFQRLLDEFGDQGIDADGDGVLTPGEIKAFFDANPDLRPMRAPGAMGRGFQGAPGMRGGRGMGPGFGPGMRPRMGGGMIGGPGGPGMGGPLFVFERLERLAAENPPEDFDVARIPGVDTDGDGVVSAEEWQAFASVAR